MNQVIGLLRRQFTGVVALVLVVSLFFVARLPTASAEDVQHKAAGYAFRPESIAMPGGFAQQTIRKVNRKYRNIDAWISSVGAGIAMNDLDGDSLANDLCITDPRIDRVVVTPVPDKAAGRYAPFVLDPGSLPMNDVMAPMGCVPGDFNEDGHTDLMVYMWGRTPILYLAKPGATGLSMKSYQPTELVPGNNQTNGRYSGPEWNSNSATVADFDGDGHDDIYIGNYFPVSPVLNSAVDGGVTMNHSMSHALNGGPDAVLRFVSTTPGTGGPAGVRYEDQSDAIPRSTSKGWTLGSSASDLDGDLMPELYIANDFGPDRLLHNRSQKGGIRFAVVQGRRGPMTPKSKRVGTDSFKGMGVDFADLNQDGTDDMFVSNITTSFGIMESNFAFMSDTSDKREIRADLDRQDAPWTDRSGSLNLAWSGWGWDVKAGDFNNSGSLAIAQATGFVRGQTDRWPNLQELATANDQMLADPLFWPHATEGDDIAGHQAMHFFVKTDSGRYADLAPALGLAVPVPTRGIATGDSDGDGRLDMAVARQWDAPVFYQNTSPNVGGYLDLKLCHEMASAGGAKAAMAGSPVVGARVSATTAAGTTVVGHVDGGGGHSGKRSFDVHLGLGRGVSGPVAVHLEWRDRTGAVRKQDLKLDPGAHTLMLGAKAMEE